MLPPTELDRSAADVVLIVDDVPDNLSVLHDALDEAGYTVLVATNGESRAAARRAGAARHRAARRGDAGHRRLRGRAPAEGRARDGAHPDRLHDRPHRHRARGRRVPGRRRRLRHQADPAARSARAHRRAHAGRAAGAPGAQCARRVRPRDDGDAHVGDAPHRVADAARAQAAAAATSTQHRRCTQVPAALLEWLHAQQRRSAQGSEPSR